ncbi:MAG: 16S rRNA (guanine(966)-N(2))-methyltransferase RsmD [Neisseriaceae bacterium]
MGKVRIIGGEHRSRILQFNDKVVGLRPTTDRVRETLFNWLGQDLTDKICLDLFAGSGVLGFEAASRGAKFVTLVDVNHEVIQSILQNKKLLKLDNIEVIQYDSINYLSHTKNFTDIIFLDPPYNTNLLDKCLRIIESNKAVFKNTLLYIEYRQVPDLSNYEILKSAKAGIVRYSLIKLL